MITHTRAPYVDIAQLGEHLPYKQRVVGSSPAIHTRKTYRDCGVMVAHVLWEHEELFKSDSPDHLLFFNINYWAVVKR